MYQLGEMMFNLRFKLILVFLLIFQTKPSVAGPTGPWTNIPIFPQAPLEIKIGSFTDGDNPDALVVILWNNGVDNRLHAVRIPPPYNGTGITATLLDNSSVLFALGDICTEGNNVVVPYVKDFNLEVSRYNGSNWSSSTIPGTTTNNFDNADCAQTTDGFFIATHDMDDDETEIFKSNNGGSSYTFCGRYDSAGPFDGAVREPLASTYSNRYVMGLNQRANGQVWATGFDTSQATPTFENTFVQNAAPPPGSFTQVQESSGGFNGSGFTFTFNINGTASVVDIPTEPGFSFTHRTLESISNNGSQYSFQGAALIPTYGAPKVTAMMWEQAFFTTPYTQTTPMPTPGYPLENVGGPVDGCLVEFGNSNAVTSEIFLAGPRVGSTGTDLFKNETPADPIFADGFESGDTSVWSFSCSN